MDYQLYIDKQIARSKETQSWTVNKYHKRSYIYARMQQFGVVGKTILCVGARDVSEMDFFKKLGFKVDGIDLWSSGEIIECDMSEMLDHPYLSNKEYDIVFACDVMEHCCDLIGFVKGLNKICKTYFVCFSITCKNAPYGINLDNWDCARHEFMNDNQDDSTNSLLKTFDQFSVVTNAVERDGKQVIFILKKK